MSPTQTKGPARILMNDGSFREVAVLDRFFHQGIRLFVHRATDDDRARGRVYAAAEWESGTFVAFGRSIDEAMQKARSRIGKKAFIGSIDRVISSIVHQVERDGRANDHSDY